VLAVDAQAESLVAREYVDGAWLETQRARTPLQRFVSPDEIGAAVVQLYTTLRSLTGCILPMDSGRPLG
jgi:3-oxoacyl-[acyl-carrier protein] reductase